MRHIQRHTTGQGFKAEAIVNLWNLVPEEKRRTPAKTLMEYNHPLQPDIDILYSAKDNPRTVTGVEVKYFKTVKAETIPKTGTREGCYAGLGQAIGLLSFGLHHVYLWHIFPIHWKKFNEDAMLHGQSYAKKRSEDYVEYNAAYYGFTAGMIQSLHLPIGYSLMSLTVGEEFSVQTFPHLHVDPRPNPVRNIQAAKDVRRLLKKTILSG